MKINSSIFNNPLINSVILYDTVDSTNEEAKKLAKRGCIDGTLVIADTQTSGKGRLGRGFSSPKNTGIYMSLILKPSMKPEQVSAITLVAALAIASAIDELEGIKPQIKWPNDILVNNKKLVGILTEMSCDAISLSQTHGLADIELACSSPAIETSLKFIVIGMGINVNNESFPDEIAPFASSLFLEGGRMLDRAAIIEAVMKHFNYFYRIFLDTLDLSALTDTYNSYLVSLGRQVVTIPYDKTMKESNPYNMDTSGYEAYTCLGLDKSGGLICETAEHRVFVVNSGEVSLRMVTR